MPRFPQFVGGAYEAQSPWADQERAINVMPEPAESAGERGAKLVPVPGSAEFARSTVDGAVLAGVEINGRVFFVGDTKLFEVMSNGSVTVRGALGSYTGRASIVASTTQLLICAGARLFVFTLATNTLVEPVSLAAKWTAGLQGTGQSHNLTINGRAYNYSEGGADTYAIIAAGIVALVNDTAHGGASADPDVTAVAGSVAGDVLLYRKVNRGTIAVLTTSTSQTVAYQAIVSGAGVVHYLIVNGRNYECIEGLAAASLAVVSTGPQTPHHITINGRQYDYQEGALDETITFVAAGGTTSHWVNVNGRVYTHVEGTLNATVAIAALGAPTAHTITINGTAYTYTEVGGEDAHDIAVALVALISASTEVTAIESPSGTVEVNNVAPNAFTITNDPSGTDILSTTDDSATTIANAFYELINAGDGDLDAIASKPAATQVKLTRRTIGRSIVVTFESVDSSTYNGDTVATIAAGLAYLVNEGDGDADVVANSETGPVVLTRRSGSLVALVISAAAVDTLTPTPDNITTLATRLAAVIAAAADGAGDPDITVTDNLAGTLTIGRIVARGIITVDAGDADTLTGTVVPESDEMDQDTVPGPFAKVAFNDNFGIALDSNSQRFRISALNDVSTWDPLDYATTAFLSENVLSMLVDHREIWLWGAKRSIGYFDSGEVDFPFAPNASGFIEAGIAAAESPARADNSIFWLGGDERGQCIVWKAAGYIPTRVSNYALEQAIQSYATISDAVGFSYQMQGHTFYHLWFPTQNVSWVLDVGTGFWHQRPLGSGSAWTAQRPSCHVFAFGKHLFGDPNSGRIFEVSAKYTTDSYIDTTGAPVTITTPIRRIRRAPPITAELARVPYNRFQLDLGLALAAGSAYVWRGDYAAGTAYVTGAVVRYAGFLYAAKQSTTANLPTNTTYWRALGSMILRWSQDGGNTWSSDHTVSVGYTAQYGYRAIWRRLGSSFHRIWEWETSDYVPWVIVDCILNGGE